MPLTIAIVDDHSLIAEALTGLIEKFAPKYRVLYEVNSGRALTERFREPKNIPDIVLLDINMPEKDMDGFATAKWLTLHHPDVRILALSAQDEEQTLITMIRNGARGYLLKNVREPQLEKALDTIAENGYVYPDWLTYKALRSMTDDKPFSKTGPDINARELEFLQYVGSELTYKEIADKMCCSPRTVEGYRDHLFEKLGVKTRVGLVISALRNNIIKLESIT